MKKRVLIAALALMLPVRIASANQSALEFLKDVEVNGMLDTYYSYNLNKPETRTDVGGGQETNRFRSFDKEDNSLTVDNFELMFQKPVSKSNRAGFTLITNYGEIAQRIVFAKHANYGRADDDDFTLSTAYVHYLADAGEAGDVDIKVGRFPTWIGAEIWESVGNPNWSRSLLYQNAIPFTHTGVSANYEVSKNFNFTGYVVNGWDSFEENNNEKSLGYQLAFEHDKCSFVINGIHGNEKDDLNDGSQQHHDARNLWDFILDLNPTEKLHINLNYDHGLEENTGHWHGLAAIVDYDFTDTFNLALRGEYFKDAGIEDSTGVYQTRTGVQQSEVEIYEVTVTANFTLSDKIMVRPEIRHDWSKDRVFDSDASYGQTTIACSVAYLF